MKKKVLTTVLFSGVVLGVASMNAFAAETEGGGSQEVSKVEVKLEEDQGNEVGSGPFKDKLAIVHKPDIFKFSNKTTTGALNLNNENINSDSQFISVNDDRKKSENEFLLGGWELTGSLSELTTDDGDSLNAKMIFKSQSLLEYNIGTLKVVNGVEDYPPLAIDKTAAAADTRKYNLNKNLVLTTNGDAQPVIEAEPTTAPKGDEVRGVATNMGDVKLAIATGDAQIAGTYSGEITWTLSPSN